MLIANPMYDNAFMRLFKNEKVTEFFIGTILGKNVLSIEKHSPEFTYIDPKDEKFKLFRMDFIVEIEDKDGERDKMIIEIQKGCKYSTDIMYFRKYLGYEYKSNTLPVITIYILNFDLPGLETAFLRIGRDCYDLIKNREIKTYTKLFENLAHECYIIQTLRITGRQETPLDRLLSVFEEKGFMESAEASKRYDYPISDEGVKDMIEILHFLGVDPDVRKVLENERYYREYLQDTFGEVYGKLVDIYIAENDTEFATIIDSKLAAQKAEIAAKDAEIAELEKELKKYEGQT